jgi:hypothetical protein
MLPKREIRQPPERRQVVSATVSFKTTAIDHSDTVTWWPLARKWRAALEPMKPAPPVMRYLLKTYFRVNPSLGGYSEARTAIGLMRAARIAGANPVRIAETVVMTAIAT